MKIHVKNEKEVRDIEWNIGRVVNDNRLSFRVEEADIISTQKNKSRINST